MRLILLILLAILIIDFSIGFALILGLIKILWIPALVLVVAWIIGYAISYCRENNKSTPKLYLIIGLIAILLIAILVSSLIHNNKSTPEIYYSPYTEYPKIVPDKEVSPADEGRDSTVCLSFLNMQLESNVHSALRLIKNIKNVRPELLKGLSIHRFESKLNIGTKKYPIDVEIYSVNDSIGCIEITLKDDIFYPLISPMFIEKYGQTYSSNFRGIVTQRWKFRNQEVAIHYNNPQRVIWHPDLQKEIITDHYDFENITIQYSDYKLRDRIDDLQDKQKREALQKKKIKDSIDNVLLQEKRNRQLQEASKQI